VYDDSTISLRVAVVDGGFRIDTRSERSNTFDQFEIWVRSMDALQVYLAWFCRSSWFSGARLRRHIVVPDGGSVAAGFLVEPIEPNSVDNRPVTLVRDGVINAIAMSSREVVELSRLLTIGLDLLELSILDLDGAPELAVVTR
jgi:hypothetical protein